MTSEPKRDVWVLEEHIGDEWLPVQVGVCWTAASTAKRVSLAHNKMARKMNRSERYRVSRYIPAPPNKPRRKGKR